MSKEIQKWLDIAMEDLDVANELFNSRRYLYATFFCQQAVEKAFKAVIAMGNKEEPPFIHNLVRLAGLADFKGDEEITEMLEDLSLHYIKGRYMVEREKLPGNKRDFASKMIKFANEVLSWSLKKSK
ncbi:MAG: HEPN domain-containing protein [Deltaproteobacteria bacterium]|nr:HEPN domain-containing protein [Deltaproteobacteria bacterium]